MSRGEEGEFCKLFFLDGQITYLGEALAGGGAGGGGGWWLEGNTELMYNIVELL